MQFYFNFIKFLFALKPLLNRGGDLDDDEIERLSKALKDNMILMGPTFIKLGQILSLHYDFLPRKTCEELQSLLDSEPTVLSIEEVDYQ